MSRTGIIKQPSCSERVMLEARGFYDHQIKLEKVIGDLRLALDKQIKRTGNISGVYEHGLEVGIIIGYLLIIGYLKELGSVSPDHHDLIDTFKNLSFAYPESFKLAIYCYLEARNSLV